MTCSWTLETEGQKIRGQYHREQKRQLIASGSDLSHTIAGFNLRRQLARFCNIPFFLNRRHTNCDEYLPEDHKTMLHWSLVFLIIAIIAAILGFGGIAGAAAGIAKILFLVFLVIWILAFFLGRRAL